MHKTAQEHTYGHKDERLKGTAALSLNSIK